VRSINTVKRLIREGRLDAIRPGAHYRVRRADVARLASGPRPLSTPAPDPLAVPRWELAAWARSHRVKSIALFGSAARGELRPDSDIDVAIELEPGSGAGLFEMVRMQDELTRLFRRAVDLGTWKSMKPTVRRAAERDAVILHARG
jgi:uncharacterized protein